MPFVANAGFFDNIINKVVGNQAQADGQPQTPADSLNSTHNSQNIPLLEPTITPDLKIVKDVEDVSVVENQALEAKSSPIGFNIEQNASSAKIILYSVKKGDTMKSIAKQLKTTEDVILASNPDIKKGDKLKVGQAIIVIPVKDKVKTEDKIVKKVVKEEAPIVVAPTQQETNIQEPAQTQLVTPPTPTPTPTTVPVTETPVVVPSDTPVGQPLGTIANGYIWPFNNGIGRISQGLHGDAAFDFAAPKGTPIHSVYDGSVLIAHPSGYNGGFGEYVVINFTDGRQAIFAHMSKVLVHPGDFVKRGDIIGLVGSTGHSTGPHLHLGVHGDLGNPYIGLKVNDKDLILND